MVSFLLFDKKMCVIVEEVGDNSEDCMLETGECCDYNDHCK